MKGKTCSKWSVALAVAALLLAGGASAQDRYVDAVDYPTPSAGWEVFHDLEDRLEADFDQLCGDTYCEGEYSDYRPLRYRCSVRQRDGVIGQCVWTFGASEASIDPVSGQVQVDAQLWQCNTPLKKGTRLTVFYAALAGQGPMLAPLPRTTLSVNDGLIGCL